MTVSLTEQIQELQRELRMRDRVYPRWIASGKLTDADAGRQLARLRAAISTLVQLQAEREPGLAL